MAQSELLTPTYDISNVRHRDAKTEEDGTEVYLPTKGKVTFLIDGKTAIREFADKMSKAKKYIFISNWQINCNTKLSSNKSFNRFLEEQIAKNGVKIRILISYIECIEQLKAGKCKPNEKCVKKLNEISKKFDSKGTFPEKISIEAILDKHPSSININIGKNNPFNRKYYLGTFHEKFIIVDGKYAFCGGMDIVNWLPGQDISSENYKWHDVDCMLEGDIVRHFEFHFKNRWEESTGTADNDKKPRSKLPYSLMVNERSSYDPYDQKNVSTIQLLITKSKIDDPFHGMDTKNIIEKIMLGGLGGISLTPKPVNEDLLQCYKESIRLAKKYIYIENQYFRHTSINESIIEALKDNPDLQVIIVITYKPEELDPMGQYALYLQSRTIRDLLEAGKERVGFFSLKHNASRKSIYVHSKVMIIDDIWFTIGSANINGRSFHLDSEINIAIKDPILAKELRIKLWKQHLQLDKKDKKIQLGDIIKRLEIANFHSFCSIWKGIAEHNKVKGKNQPFIGRIILHEPLPGMTLQQYSERLKELIKKYSQEKKFDPNSLVETLETLLNYIEKIDNLEMFVFNSLEDDIKIT